MKKIVVIGSGGFIGRSLEEHLKQKGYNLECVTHECLDLLDESKVRNFFESNRFDIVIHSAIWNASKSKGCDTHRELDYNLRMYLNVARCCDFFGKMIYFGSGAEFDKRHPICSVKEEDFGKNLPANDYGLAKFLIQHQIDNSKNIYNLRVFGLYGKYEDYRRKFITGCCAKAVLGLPITIRQNVFFDFLYIDDFCRMVNRFIDLDKPKYHTYNIVTGKRIDLISLAEIVRKQSQKDIPIYVCKDGLANEYTANGERLQNELNYHEFVSYEESIACLLEYFKDHTAELDIHDLLYQG